MFFRRKKVERKPTSPQINGYSTETYLAYHEAIRTALVCPKCQWHVKYHDDGECPTAAQIKQIIERDGA